ncbi:hypothetical protein ACFXKY_09295 [Streptomyces canus]|uniref:hypothetical protein n=1 Tax=Streptomyces canus TaxID=58343 RepID=UPI0036C409EA
MSASSAPWWGDCYRSDEPPSDIEALVSYLGDPQQAVAADDPDAARDLLGRFAHTDTRAVPALEAGRRTGHPSSAARKKHPRREHPPTDRTTRV